MTILPFQLRAFVMMSQYKIGISLMTLSMIHLMIFILKSKDLLTGTPTIKKLSPEEVRMKNIPWLSADILKLIKVRNKVFARKRENPTNCKRLYNLLRNRVNRELKK